MDCNHARELIQEKLEGDLDAGLQHELKKHLVECRDCRDYEARFETLHSLLERQPIEKAPGGFAARVAAAALAKRRRALVAERRNLYIAGSVVAAVVLAAVALLPFFVILPGTSEITEKLAVLKPEIPEEINIREKLTELTPEVPQSVPTLAVAVESIQSSWESLPEMEIPELGLTGTVIILLGIFAAVAAALEGVYLTLVYRRKR